MTSRFDVLFGQKPLPEPKVSKSEASMEVKHERDKAIAKFKGESHSYSHTRPVRKVVSRYAR